MSKKIPYEENHRINENGELEKKCNRHHTYFPDESPWFPCTDEYYYTTNQNKTDGLHPLCKRCSSKRAYENQKKDLERHYTQQRRYYKENVNTRKLTALRGKKRRDNGKYYEWLKTDAGKQCLKKSKEKRKSKEHVYYEVEWESVKKYFDYECCYCGLPIDRHWILYRGKKILGDFHKDHAISEGRNDIKNMLPACELCNSEKHNRTLNEFYNPSSPNYTRERYLKIYQWLRYDCKKFILPKRRYKGQRLTERLKEIELIKTK